MALSHLDQESRAFSRQAGRRVFLYAACAGIGWLVFSEHSLPSLAEGVRFAFSLGALISIARAVSAKLPVHAPILTYWDEALLQNLISLGVQITAGAIG